MRENSPGHCHFFLPLRAKMRKVKSVIIDPRGRRRAESRRNFVKRGELILLGSDLLLSNKSQIVRQASVISSTIFGRKESNKREQFHFFLLLLLLFLSLSSLSGVPTLFSLYNRGALLSANIARLN